MITDKTDNIYEGSALNKLKSLNSEKNQAQNFELQPKQNDFIKNFF